MNSNFDQLQELVIHREEQVAEVVRESPSILLSGSVPSLLTYPVEVNAAVRARNKRYCDASDALVIRQAVQAFVREVVARDLRIVFGAHPSISPLLLNTVREAMPVEILIFQPRSLRARVSKSMPDLAACSGARLIITDQHPSATVPQYASAEYKSWLHQSASLSFSRRCMMRVPGLRAAIVLGGMDGAREEALLFRTTTNLQGICYAYGGSGSAAQELLNAAPNDYRGGVEERILRNPGEPSLAMRHVFEDFSPLAGRCEQPQ